RRVGWASGPRLNSTSVLAGQDSNLQPPDPKSGVLPVELPARATPRYCRRIGPRSCYNLSMSTRPVSAIVLAAGEGVRMRSDRPKPLHLLCGRPMIMHVLGALTDLRVKRTVVVTGHGSERVTKKV